jgi:polyphosphate glucokinase
VHFYKIVRMNTSFGIDVGGSGIKGAIVDLDTGEFVGERIKISTPKPATPEAVAATVLDIVHKAKWDGPIGITVPSIVKGQMVLSAANIDKSWIGTDAYELFHRHLGSDRHISILNDADAAGLAEVAFGEAKAKTGQVIFLTLGTGIGSAFLMDGKLWPNTELGHLIVDGDEAEHQASSAAKDDFGLSFKKWAQRVDRALHEYEALFNPDLFIIGGGISRRFDKWGPHLTVQTEVIPAQLRNKAGIIGAAMAVTKDIAP